MKSMLTVVIWSLKADCFLCILSDGEQVLHNGAYRLWIYMSPLYTLQHSQSSRATFCEMAYNPLNPVLRSIECSWHE